MTAADLAACVTIGIAVRDEGVSIVPLMILRQILFLFLISMAARETFAAESPPELRPGGRFAVRFLEMPPTFYALDQKKHVAAQMTICLPTNYDPARKHPLFIFLTGGNGGTGGNPEVASAITEGRDFICVSVPLFRAPESQAMTRSGMVILTAADGRYMWPFFRTMLGRLEEIVANIDPAHRVLGGFSNGAHAAAALLEASDGEVARRFSAFFFGEGGGKLQHFELLRGKPFLMLSSNAQSRPRAQEICDAAREAGALTAFVFEDVGRHAFPPSAYPAVRAWLRGPAVK